MSRVLLKVDLYMTWDNQVFFVNLVVTDPTHEMVFLNVISQPTGAAAELSTIVKTHKYRGLLSQPHFGQVWG
jgi:hypothetical protein